MAEHLNAQQVAQIEGKIRDAIQGAINSMNLRKAAVEMALDLVKAGAGPHNPTAFKEAARDIYDFMTGPASDIKVTLE